MRSSKKVRSTSQIKSAGSCEYNVNIRNCFRHGGFIRTKLVDNPGVIEKKADLSGEAYESWINDDANLETAKKNSRNNLSSTDKSKR
ncbi:hypothetical protein AVEN_153221-1 [Araneus ventricosus]|uniref:Uncharacterized protein n=1 Tax=Araneus ventricosus TaxID=182803 RepID=A0A4Y2NJ24_ARAVE|nr:hypothetical protein AVEN_153221-1 [Araneus ventricosus]